LPSIGEVEQNGIHEPWVDTAGFPARVKEAGLVLSGNEAAVDVRAPAARAVQRVWLGPVATYRQARFDSARCDRIPPALPDRARRWVLDVFGHGSQIVQARRLALGGWHVNHALTVIDSRGRVHRVVLRRWARSGWEADDPDYTVAREARVLALLLSTTIPVPAVIAADPTAECCDVPAVLLTRLPGHPPGPADRASDGFCRQLAEMLAAIHNLGDSAQSCIDRYRLYYDSASAELPGWMPATRTWKRAIATVRQPPPGTAMTLIHRDYHPENTLWSR
jgi:aminoglycoside phosphotransferase (APT) family kinase protein